MTPLLDFCLKRISTTMRCGFFRYFTPFIGRLPIRRIDFSKPAEKAEHDPPTGSTPCFGSSLSG
jgi:hypothetical protein